MNLNLKHNSITILSLVMLSIFLIPQLSFSQINFNEVYHAVESNDVNNPENLILGDFNNDGIMDFCGSNPFQKDLYVSLSTANLAAPNFVKIVDGQDFRNLAVGDYNQDGNLDIMGSDIFGDKMIIELGDGAGNFSELTIANLEYGSIHFADMDADGTSEMLMGINDEIRIYELSNGTHTLLHTIPTGFFSGTPNFISSFQQNGDDKLDMLVTYSNGIYVYQQNSLLDYTEVVISDESFSNTFAVPTDINGDGVWDYFAHSSGSRRTDIITSTSATEYERITLPSDNGPNTASIFGDLDNDGDDDVLMITSEGVNTGTTSIFENDNGTFTPEIITDFYSNNVPGGVFDFNDDGNLDIYLFSNDFFDPGLLFYVSFIDDDGDGFGIDVDCDDTNPDINPGATEIPYNGVDDDCDAQTFDDDLDQDGFANVDDCEDTNPDINPGATETPYNGLDDDCDPATLDDDLDEDGFTFAEDCDDGNPNINPDAIEIPDNGIDEDCKDGDLSAVINFNEGSIEFYPNPVQDYLNIVVDGIANFEVEVIDVSGRLLLKDANPKQIDFSTFEKGIYFLKFGIEGQISTTSIIVN